MAGTSEQIDIDTQRSHVSAAMERFEQELRKLPYRAKCDELVALEIYLRQRAEKLRMEREGIQGRK